MNTQNQLLKNSLPLIAAGLGDKLGVRVTVSGDQAWTDGQTINIPDFNITSKEQKNAVLGFISHEAAHLKFDSFLGMKFVITSIPVMQKNYWNIFEDLRIEKEMIDHMVGTKNWLNQIWLNRQAEGNRPSIDETAEPDSAICELLLMSCRVHYRKQTHLTPYLDAAENVFCRIFGYKMFLELTALLAQELPKLQSSIDAHALAVMVEKLIANHKPEEESKPVCSNETPEDEEESDGEADSGNPSEEEIKTAIAKAMQSTESFDDMADFASTLECLAQTNPDCSQIMLPRVVEIKDFDDGKLITSAINGTSSQLTAKLQAIVEEETRVRRKTKTSGLKLNAKVLHRYAVNDSRLFKSKTKRLEIDTTVEICIDNSGSMISPSGNLLMVAKEAQLALAMALTRINGVSVSASAFPAGNNTDVFTLLSEGESVRKLSQRYHALQADTDNTPTATALLHCLKTVLESRKSKKVIIIITDGYPDYDEREPLTKLVQQAQNNGITVIGVAIGRIAKEPFEFCRYFQNALFIQDIRELKSELFKVARNILVS